MPATNRKPDSDERVSQKIRILYTIPNFTTAGSGQAMVNIIDRLDRNRFEPTVAVNALGGSLVDHLEANGVTVVESPFEVPVQPLSTLAQRVWVAGRPFRDQYDLWHSFNWKGDFTEPLIAYGSGTRAWMYTKKNMGFASKSWRIRSLLARRIAVQNDAMISTFFNKPWFRYKVRYIPTGIDVERWEEAPTDDSLRERLGIPDTAVVVVCVGEVRPLKNQGALLPALADVPDAHLVLAGRLLDDAYTESLLAAAERLRVSDRFHLLGLVEDVPGLLKACDIFALVSTSEGSPIAMVEALAVGKPGVYSAIPGIRERLTDGHDGFVVDANNHADISRRLRELADSATLRQSMGDSARQTAELRGRVESEAARYETLYMELSRP